jgi:hypothetical protein
VIDPDVLAFVQFIAYVTLTIAGITVAIISLRQSYRSNFGWPPILLDVTHGLKSKSVEDRLGQAVFVELELWNRRTYPVVLRSLVATSSRLEFEQNYGRSHPDDDWIFHNSKRAEYRPENVRAGGEHLKLVFEGMLFEGQSLDDLDTNIEFQCNLYDPQRDKRYVVRRPLNYTMKAKPEFFTAEFLTKLIK